MVIGGIGNSDVVVQLNTILIRSFCEHLIWYYLHFYDIGCPQNLESQGPEFPQPLECWPGEPERATEAREARRSCEFL